MPVSPLPCREPNQRFRLGSEMPASTICSRYALLAFTGSGFQ